MGKEPAENTVNSALMNFRFVTINTHISHSHPLIILLDFIYSYNFFRREIT